MYIPLGNGATSVVQAANFMVNEQKVHVAIKRINLEQCGATIEELQVSIMCVSYNSSFISENLTRGANCTTCK